MSVAYAGRVEVLPLGQSSSRTLPSFIYLHRAGRREAGDDAVRSFLVSGHQKTDCWNCPLAPYGWDTDCRQYLKGGGCNDARLVSGVKHELAKLGFAGTNSWATDFTVGSLVGVVLSCLKREADNATGHNVGSVVLGHPVEFAGADPENRADRTPRRFAVSSRPPARQASPRSRSSPSRPRPRSKVTGRLVSRSRLTSAVERSTLQCSTRAPVLRVSRVPRA